MNILLNFIVAIPISEEHLFVLNSFFFPLNILADLAIYLRRQETVLGTSSYCSQTGAPRLAVKLLVSSYLITLIGYIRASPRLSFCTGSAKSVPYSYNSVSQIQKRSSQIDLRD